MINHTYQLWKSMNFCILKFPIFLPLKVGVVKSRDCSNKTGSLKVRIVQIR